MDCHAPASGAPNRPLSPSTSSTSCTPRRHISFYVVQKTSIRDGEECHPFHLEHHQLLPLAKGPEMLECNHSLHSRDLVYYLQEIQHCSIQSSPS